MAHSPSGSQNLDAEIETVQDQESQQPHHPSDRNFEFIRKYLLTTVEDPSDIPEARRNLLVQLTEVLGSIENRRVARMWWPKTEYPFALSHTGLGISMAICNISQ